MTSRARLQARHWADVPICIASTFVPQRFVNANEATNHSVSFLERKPQPNIHHVDVRRETQWQEGVGPFRQDHQPN